MPHIETIHFVAGLGQAEGKPLLDRDLLAMRLASKYHPRADLFLHTSATVGTADNYQNVQGLRRVTYDKSKYSQVSGWQVTNGQHMSDVLRLHVLLSCRSRNALYLDTDAYCTRNLDSLADIEGCAMARLGPFMIANGLIYAGQDRSFLQAWLNDLHVLSKPPKSHVDYSCRLPHELALCQPGLTVLDCAKYHGYTGDGAMYGAWLEPAKHDEVCRLVRDSAVVHTMTPRPDADQTPGTVYEAVLKQLELLL